MDRIFVDANYYRAGSIQDRVGSESSFVGSENYLAGSGSYLSKGNQARKGGIREKENARKNGRDVSELVNQVVRKEMELIETRTH